MRSLFLPLAIGALAAVVPAQSLTTLFAANNGGGAGWTQYFDINVTNGFVLLGVDINSNLVAPTQGSVDIYMTAAGGTHVGNEGVPGTWTLMSTGETTTSEPTDTPTSVRLSTPVVVNPGVYGVAVEYVGGFAPAYTNGTGANQMFSNADLSMTLGSSSTLSPNTPGGTLFTPRVWNGTLYYNAFACSQNVGDGCGGDDPGAIFENFTGNFDLGNTSGTAYIFGGTDYTIVPGFGTIDPPPGTNLITFGDDDTQQITLPFMIPTRAGMVSDVFMCSNGWLSLDVTASTDLSPTIPELLAGENRICALWTDLNPAAGGTIETHLDANGDFNITFIAVPQFGVAGTSNDFQITISSSGLIEVKYGAVSAATCLVGYSHGNGIVAGEEVDLSSPMLAGQTGPGLVNDLALSADARPVQMTTMPMTISEIPASAIGGALLIGFTGFAVPVDLGIIGMNGCSLTTGGAISVPFATGAATAQIMLPIGTTAVPVFTQAAVIAPGVNNLGVITSNGVNLQPDFQ